MIEFPNDSSNIDMKKIVSFYKRIYSIDKQKVADRISESARERCDINNAMNPIVCIFQNWR